MNHNYLPVCVFSIASILMSVYCFIMYFTKRARSNINTYFYLLINQVIDFFLCIITIMNPNAKQDRDNFCIIQGFLEQFTSFLLIEWDIIIILKIFLEISGRSLPLKISIMISIAISLTLASIPIPLGSYGTGEMFCSIKTSGDKKYLIFFCFYIPFWVCCIITVLFLYKIEKISRERMFDESQRSQYFFNLRLFPVSLAVCYFMLSVSRIIEVSNDNIIGFNIFDVIALCVSRSHGFINGIITIIIYRRSLIGSMIVESENLDNISRLVIGESRELTIENH